jgi:[ribosomal protein S5]-alanine N-acetyltransferase
MSLGYYSEFNRYLETRHSVQTLDSCCGFVRRCNADDREHLFGVFLKDSGRYICNAKLGAINQIHQRG